MKDKIAIIIMILVVIGVIYAVFWSKRFVREVATPIYVEQVEPGVKCAYIATDDGAAIDCWKTDGRK